jgi:hypothetical protein
MAEGQLTILHNIDIYHARNMQYYTRRTRAGKALQIFSIFLFAAHLQITVLTAYFSNPATGALV